MKFPNKGVSVFLGETKSQFGTNDLLYGRPGNTTRWGGVLARFMVAVLLRSSLLKRKGGAS